MRRENEGKEKLFISSLYSSRTSRSEFCDAQLHARCQWKRQRRLLEGGGLCGAFSC